MKYLYALLLSLSLLSESGQAYTIEELTRKEVPPVTPEIIWLFRSGFIA